MPASDDILLDARRRGRSCSAIAPATMDAEARSERQQEAAEARRAWLGRARQADRHDVDACRRGHQAPVLPRNAPATPARSIRWPPAACRSRSARRPRPCRSWSTAARPINLPCAGARSATPTMPRAGSSATSEGRPDACRHPGAVAALHRHHRTGAAALFGHKDRRRARLRPGARRRNGRNRAAAR